MPWHEIIPQVIGVLVVEKNLKARLNGKFEYYKKLVESLPEPNEGRIEELKEAIRDGTLVTPEAVRVSAERLYEVFKNGMPPN